MKIAYRPEIDGLRGIAVIAVIFYHAQITIFGQNLLKGGFIGVDIFFVISGYLIASLILKELKSTGKFSFAYFYERRARRLLPALFVVILTSLPFAWVYLLPIPFKDFANSILSSIAFGSNFYFYYSGTLYGAESGLLKPFLHTWSLSVEEQFYLFFPIFLIICFRFFKKYLTHIIVVVFFISLGIAEWGSHNYPSLNFYILPTRGWELLAGVMLAKLESNNVRPSNRILNEIFILIGLILIGYSIVFFHDEMLLPSFYTLCPIIGVMLIIWFSNKEEFITKILSSKFFVGVGLISYSLYLWHFPLFSFARIKHPSISDYDKLEILFLTVVLSILTFFLIEKPFRNKNIINKKVFISSIVLVIIFFISSYILTIKTGGFENRLHVFLKKELKKNPWEILKDKNGLCFDRKDNHCSFNKENKKKLFLIGDSHAESISSEFFKKLKNKKINFVDMNRKGCFYLPYFDTIDKKTKKVVENCSEDIQDNIRSELLSNKNSIVIINALYKEYLKKNGTHNYVNKKDNKTILNSFVNSLQYLLDNDLYVVLIYPTPEVGFNLPKKLMNLLPKGTFNANNFLTENPITTSFKIYKEDNSEVFKVFNKFNHKNLIKIYPHKLFCNTQILDRCLTHDGKNIYYFDEHHLSSKGSEILVNEIYANIKKLF